MKIAEDGKTVTYSEREQATIDSIDFKIRVLRRKRKDAIREALEEHKGRPSKAFVEHVSKGILTVTKEGALTSAA